MKIQDLLQHHGIARNPFSEEDARTDPIFKEYCIEDTYHPAWEKIFGNPGDPSTSIVLGEKGAGKTALRLQIEQMITKYNAEHPHARCFTVVYDDFNPFLDEFRSRFSHHRRTDKVLNDFQLWDHMDAILSLAVTQLVDRILSPRGARERPQPFDVPADYRRRLTKHQRRDLLLLAACYDNSKGAPVAQRWWRLRGLLHHWRAQPWGTFLLGLLVTGAVATGAGYLWYIDQSKWVTPIWWVYLAAVVVAWLPWLIRAIRRFLLAQGIGKRNRVISRESVPLTQMLASFSANDLSGQPLPNKDRTDDRYSLLDKLQAVLESLDYSAMIVLVDRVDEPHLVNGSADAMRALVWPMLDNKFLKQEGFGIKFLLPKELAPFIDREDSDFYQRARLDKQNLIPSLDWTGESLFDLANARLAACATGSPKPHLLDFFDQNTTRERLFNALRELRVPRHAFRFLYRLMVAHCNKYSDQAPVWRIGSETFEAEFALYRREQQAGERGLGAG